MCRVLGVEKGEGCFSIERLPVSSAQEHVNATHRKTSPISVAAGPVSSHGCRRLRTTCCASIHLVDTCIPSREMLPAGNIERVKYADGDAGRRRFPGSS